MSFLDSIDDEHYVVNPHLHDSDTRYKPGPVALAAAEWNRRAEERFFAPISRKPTRRKGRPRKKKKVSQPKIDKIFDIQKNEDGYPIKDCEFEPVEGKHVYRPPGYAANYPYPKLHCEHCHLKPCLVSLHFDESREKRKELWDEEKTGSYILSETRMFFSKEWCKLFHVRYSKGFKPPSCVVELLEHVQRTFCEEIRSDGDSLDSDSETELHFDNIGVLPKGTARDWQDGDPPAQLLANSYQLRAKSMGKIDEEKTNEEDSISSEEMEFDGVVMEPDERCKPSYKLPNCVKTNKRQRGHGRNKAIAKKGKAAKKGNGRKRLSLHDIIDFDSDSSEDDSLSQLVEKRKQMERSLLLEGMGPDASLYKLDVICSNDTGLEFVKVVKKSTSVRVNRVSL